MTCKVIFHNSVKISLRETTLRRGKNIFFILLLKLEWDYTRSDGYCCLTYCCLTLTNLKI